jgi:hypothetical protein
MQQTWPTCSAMWVYSWRHTYHLHMQHVSAHTAVRFTNTMFRTKQEPMHHDAAPAPMCRGRLQQVAHHRHLCPLQVRQRDGCSCACKKEEARGVWVHQETDTQVT